MFLLYQYLLLATGMCNWHTAPASKVLVAPAAMVVCACFEMRLAPVVCNATDMRLVLTQRNIVYKPKMHSYGVKGYVRKTSILLASEQCTDSEAS